ncbi:MAG: adenosine kinase [Fibrobacterota bacterium]
MSVDFLGIGSPLIDMLAREEELIEKFGLTLGGMLMVEEDISKQITGAMKNPEMACGGSAANTIFGLANLGVSTGFLGVIGKDDPGKFFSSSLNKSGIKSHLIEHEELPTGCVASVVSDNSERTMATCLGAASSFSPDMISEEMFKGVKFTHVEGYLIFNEPLIRKIMACAKNSGSKVSFDMASFNIVEDFKPLFKDLVMNYVDIAFANEEEAKSYTGKDPDEALDDIAKETEIAVVKTGKTGSLAKRGDEKASFGIFKAAALDTTAAGDLYAAGFLYGLGKGMTLENCCRAGALTSSKVVEVMGSVMNESVWEEIRKQISP